MSLSGNIGAGSAMSSGYFWADLASNILAAFLVLFLATIELSESPNEDASSRYSSPFSVLSRQDFIRALHAYALDQQSEHYRIIGENGETTDCDAINKAGDSSLILIAFKTEGLALLSAPSCSLSRRANVLFVPESLQSSKGGFSAAMNDLLADPGDLENFTQALARLLEGGNNLSQGTGTGSSSSLSGYGSFLSSLLAALSTALKVFYSVCYIVIITWTYRKIRYISLVEDRNG
jgi:hypothetical protein